jgi:hypothetical protein
MTPSGLVPERVLFLKVAGGAKTHPKIFPSVLSKGVGTVAWSSKDALHQVIAGSTQEK